MREKPVSQDRIEKYIRFLTSVFNASDNNDLTNLLTLSEIAKRFKVSSGAPKALHDMGIIQKQIGSKNTWTWKGESPSKVLALKVLNFLLHKNKKTVHVPIPEFAGIADSLKTIIDRLGEIYVQHERGLKTSKSGHNGNIDLFRVEDQRLFLIGSLLPTIHSSNSPYPHGGMEERNFLAIEIADDVLKQLLQRKIM